MLLWSGFASAQDTTYFDDKDNKIKSLRRASYYKVRYEMQESLFREVTFYPSGQMRSEGWFVQDSVKMSEGAWRAWHANGQLEEEGEYRRNKRVGKWRNWYANGQLKRDIDYVEGAFQGMRLTYWENGRLKRRDSLFNGEVIRGLCLDSSGSPIEYFDYYIPPGFPGGVDGFVQFIMTEVRYPYPDKINNVEGRVLVHFMVDTDGHVRNVKVRESASSTLERAVVKAIEYSGRQWEPAMVDGEPVRFYFAVPVNFKISPD